MLPPDTIDEIDGYWVSHLGCPPDRLFKARVVVVPHSAFKGYQGLFLVRRSESCIIAAPAELMDLIHTCVHNRPVDEVFGSGLWRLLLPDAMDRVVGPAVLTYADASTLRPTDETGVRPLTPADAAAVGELRSVCGEDDWDRAGILAAHKELAGSWEGERLAAIAGYEMWGERIAHIGVIVRPSLRGKGHGRAAVAAVARAAIEQGLIAQFRAMTSNLPALALAESIGFEEYAETIAIGLNVPAIRQAIETDDAEPLEDDSES